MISRTQRRGNAGAALMRRKMQPTDRPARSSRRRHDRGLRKKVQSACKPGSVWPRGRPRNVAAIPLGRRLRAASSDQPGRRSGEWIRSLRSCRPYSVLLPAGLAMPRPLLDVRCALTAPFHPDPDACAPGGLLSVALSLGSPPPDVIRRRISVEPGLSSPAKERPPGRLADWGIPRHARRGNHRGENSRLPNPLSAPPLRFQSRRRAMRRFAQGAF